MSMSVINSELERLVDGEMARGIENNGPFHSRHEAYAVILEEYEEAAEEMETVKDALKGIWYCVKNDIDCTGEPRTVTRKAIHAAAEMIQVAAMANKFIKLEEER